MANPQIEDGHVDLANEIVEALAKIRISGEEMQCLWVIFRKTYGWHKKQDDIALSQFCEYTNLKKPAVCRAISKLLSKKIIVIIKKDNGISSYGFNKDFETWQPLSKKITLSKKIIRGQKPLSKKRHTKERLVLQKKSILSDDEWKEEILKLNPWINWDDINREMDTWLLNNPGRQKTRKFIANWILRKQKDKPMLTRQVSAQKEEQDPIPELRDAISKGWKI